MRIPSQLLTTTATIADRTGETGTGGPAYGPTRTVRGRLEARRRLVRTPTGEDLVSTASLLVRPETTVAPDAQVVVNGRTYVALDVTAPEGLTRPAYREVILHG